MLFIALPLYWLIVSSFKAPATRSAQPAAVLARTRAAAPTTRSAFKQYDFGIYFRNSRDRDVIATALVLILGTLAGYALGRLPMRGKFTTHGDAADDLACSRRSR